VPHVHHHDSTSGSEDAHGEVIAKLMEDAYYMRVNNRVTQAPPLRTREADHEATSCSPTDNGCNRTRGELKNPNRTRASARGPSQGGHRAGGAGGSRAVVAPATQAAEAAAAGAPHTGLEGEPVAGAIAKAEATQTATSSVSHVAAAIPVAESRKFDAKNPPRQARTTASPPSLLDLAIYCSQRNSSL
jgi:hypothetical protein